MIKLLPGLKVVSLALFSLAFALATAEATVRFLGLDDALRLSPYPTRGWQHVPGVKFQHHGEGRGLVEINAHGFRDRTRPLVKSSGTFRVLVLGDSMTESVQVNLEETFLYLAAAY